MNDFQTAKWLSQMIGRKPPAIRPKATSPAMRPRPLQRHGARLDDPDEIMQLPPHVQLLRVQGKPVIIARKLRY